MAAFSLWPISFPEPTCLLVSTKTLRVLVLTKRHVGSGNEIALWLGLAIEVNRHFLENERGDLSFFSVVLN